jgi:3-oxoacyl-[acyl-carrier protein] reductase
MGAGYPRKVALVTDALTGAGDRIAVRLAARGFGIAVGHNDEIEAADLLVDRIIESGGRAVAIRGDVALPGDAARLVSETVRLLGRLDLVVQNDAGRQAPARGTDPLFTPATLAALYLRQHAKPVLSPGGRILTVAAGDTAADGLFALCVPSQVEIAA